MRKDVAKNDVIKLTYIENGITYHGEIDRPSFISQMKHMIKWYADCNENSTALCEILPTMESMTVNNDIIKTQDIPFFEYKIFGDSEARCMKFRRFYKIIWETINFQCQKAKNNSK